MCAKLKIGHFADADEAEFMTSFESDARPLQGELSAARRRQSEGMARAALSEDRAKISLRVPKRDLVPLKSRALQEGVPYQTLINSLIRRYVSG